MYLRFRTKTRKEIDMLFNLPALIDTVAGREMWDGGVAQGLERGREQGLERGREEGVLGLCHRLAKKKLGKLPASVVSQIGKLDYLQLEALGEAMLDISSITELKKWLADRAK